MKTYCCYCGAYLETLTGKAAMEHYNDEPCYDCGQEAQHVHSSEGRALLYLFKKMIERSRS